MDPLKERIDRVAETIERDIGPGVVISAWIVCNNCGRSQPVDTVVQDGEARWDPPEGWALGGFGEDADYCPDCAAKR